jgi:hypothetical protein
MVSNGFGIIHAAQHPSAPWETLQCTAEFNCAMEARSPHLLIGDDSINSDMVMRGDPALR